jgi:carboxypeptidase C (cathepsin A)
MKKNCNYVILILAFMGLSFWYAAFSNAAHDETKTAPVTSVNKAPELSTFETVSVTQHSIVLNNKTIYYTATAGFLPLKDESGKVEANVFFIAYVKKNVQGDPQRPVTFAFNGGPGAASMWLHMGGLGPKRVIMEAGGTIMPHKLQITDNEFTWLDVSDLVFVDPIGTGFSRAAPGVDTKKFYEVQEDIRVASRFIRLYLTQNERWLSPLYIVGESYGTTRTAGVIDKLQSEFGIYPHGVILISSVLDFQTVWSSSGNDLPYILGLPSCTASAWYHKRLPAKLQVDLKKAMDEVETWSTSEYMTALAKGDRLTKEEEDRIADKLVAYTGLSKTYILNNHLRISNVQFARELMRNEGRFLGSMDGRVLGVATSRASEVEPFDPAFELTIVPYLATFNDYIRRDLKFETSLNYEYLPDEVRRAWKWSADGHYLNVSESLSRAMAANNRLRVFNVAGIYDLRTPYFGQRYTLNHLGLDESLRGNIIFMTYPTGHQIYTSQDVLKMFKTDISEFITTGK